MSPQKHSPQQATVERTTPRPIRILHLSDPQYGRFHRFGKASGTPGDKTFDRLVSRIFDDLKTFLDPLSPTRSGSKDQLVDLVVVSGDLTEWATKPEFQQLAEEIRWLAESLDLPLSRFVFVPGNHDVNRRKSKEYFDECAENGEVPVSPFVAKWAPYNEFFADFYRSVEDPPVFSGDQPWTWYEFEELGLALAGLNSTMAESHLDDSHYGLVGDQQYRWFSDRFGESDAPWKLAVVHHNIIRFSAGNDDSLTDSDDFVRQLGPHVAIALHGHLHNQKIDRLSSGTLVLATGSAAHLPLKLDPIPLDWDVANDYQVLELVPGIAKQMARRYDGGAKRWVGDTRISGNEWKLKHDLQNGPVPPDQENHGNDRLYEQMFPWQEEGPYSHVSELFLRTGLNPLYQESEPHNTTWALAEEVQEIEELRAETAGGRVFVRQDDRVGYSVVRLTGTGGSRVIGVGEEYSFELIERFAKEVAEPRRLIAGASRFEFVHGGRRQTQALIDEIEAKFGIQLRSYRSYIDLVDLAAFESKQLSWLSQRKEYDADLYVEHRVKPVTRGSGAASDNALPGVAYLKEAAKQITVVLADSGAGKTFLLRQLCASLSAVEREDRRVPIFVELSKRDKTQDLVGLVLAAFNDRRVDITRSIIEHLLQHDRLFIILDGYDELAIRTSFRDAARAVSSIVSGVSEAQFPPVVLSSRRQHVEHDGALITPLGTRPSQLAFVEPFDEDQVEEALAKLLRQSASGFFKELTLGEGEGITYEVDDTDAKNAPGIPQIPIVVKPGEEEPEPLHALPATLAHWRIEAKQFVRILDQLPNLGELASNPRLLSFLYDLRIELAEIAKSPSQRSTFNRARAYGMVTDRWLKQDRELRPEQMGEVSPSVAQRCVRRLAMAAWTQQNELGIDHFKAAAGREAVKGWEPTQLARWLSDRTFFSRVEQSYSFMHRSTLEYLLSEMAAEALAHSLPPEFMDDLATTFRAVPPSSLFGELLKELLESIPPSLSDLNTLISSWETDKPLPELRTKLGLKVTRDFLNLNRMSEDLSQENWENTIHTNCNYQGSILPKRMQGSRFINCNLDSSDATAADLRDSLIEGGTMRQMNASNSDFGGSSIAGANASLAKLLWKNDPTNSAFLGFGWANKLSINSLESWGSNLISSNAAHRRVAWSPDGFTLASLDPGNVVIWNAATGKKSCVFFCQFAPLSNIAWSPNGESLAALQQSQIIIWQTRTRTEKRRITCEFSELTSLAWSPNGLTLATGCENGQVLLWEASTGEQRLTLTGHKGRISSTEWSPDGTTLATGGLDGQTILWDTKTGVKTRRFVAKKGQVILAWAPDGIALATVVHQRITIWDGTTGKQTREFEIQGIARDISWSSDGTALAIVFLAGNVEIWSANGPNMILELSAFDDVSSISWSPAAHHVAICERSGNLTLLDLTTRSEIRRFGEFDKHLKQIAWSPDSTTLATVDFRKRLVLWSTEAGEEFCSEIEAGVVNNVEWSPDGKTLATTDGSSAILWDSATWQRTLELETDSMSILAWSPAGKTLATIGSNGETILWNTKTGKEIKRFNGYTNNELAAVRRKSPLPKLRSDRRSILSASWSSDGVILRTFSADGKAILWNTETDRKVRELELPRSEFAAWSPDGAALATGKVGGFLEVWDTTTGEKISELSTGFTTSVGWNPDNKTLILGRIDGSAIIWQTDLERGAVRVLNYKGRIDNVAWSPDGRVLASSSAVLAINRTESISGSPEGAETVFLASSESGSSVVRQNGNRFEYSKTGDCELLWFANGLCRFDLTETAALASLGINQTAKHFSIS
jgi:WD40 repeat protein